MKYPQLIVIALLTLTTACAAMDDELDIADRSAAIEYGFTIMDGPWDRSDEHYDVDGACISLNGTTVTGDDEEGSCQGLTASSKKSDAKTEARNNARNEASRACNDKYNYSSFARDFYDWVCTETCDYNGGTYRAGSELQLCDDSVTSVDYRYEARGCGSRPFRSKRWFADVEILGECGCVCDGLE